jgi:hypothetical protein
MSLTFEVATLHPRPTRKPAAKPARKPKAAAKPSRKPALSPAELVLAERLFSSFAQQLAPGDHEFATLRLDFAEWCEVADMAPASHVRVAAWLRQAGFSRHRVGHHKTLIYRKPAAAVTPAIPLAAQPQTIMPQAASPAVAKGWGVGALAGMARRIGCLL